MFKNNDEYMQKIADTLYEYMDEEFIDIVLEIERCSGDSIGYTGEYLDRYGKKQQLLSWEKDLDFGDLFHELYQTMTADTDKHKWNRAKVTLTDDKKLNIKFEWDQELVDELEEAGREYDLRWDDSLTQEEKDIKYKEMVANGELPDLSKISIT